MKSYILPCFSNVVSMQYDNMVLQNLPNINYLYTYSMAPACLPLLILLKFVHLFIVHLLTAHFINR